LAQLTTARSEFSTDFVTVFEERVRPSTELIIDRLRRNGGDGVIVERPEDGRLSHNHLFTLWMSLDGEIIGEAHVDRLPYLRLEADVDKRLVTVSEGDIWEGHDGNRGGKVAEWKLSEITPDAVTQEALAILRRSFSVDVRVPEDLSGRSREEPP